MSQKVQQQIIQILDQTSQVLPPVNNSSETSSNPLISSLAFPILSNLIRRHINKTSNINEPITINQQNIEEEQVTKEETKAIDNMYKLWDKPDKETIKQPQLVNDVNSLKTVSLSQTLKQKVAILQTILVPKQNKDLQQTQQNRIQELENKLMQSFAEEMSQKVAEEICVESNNQQNFINIEENKNQNQIQQNENLLNKIPEVELSSEKKPQDKLQQSINQEIFIDNIENQVTNISNEQIQKIQKIKKIMLSHLPELSLNLDQMSNKDIQNIYNTIKEDLNIDLCQQKTKTNQDINNENHQQQPHNQNKQQIIKTVYEPMEIQQNVNTVIQEHHPIIQISQKNPTNLSNQIMQIQNAQPQKLASTQIQNVQHQTILHSQQNKEVSPQQRLFNKQINDLMNCEQSEMKQKMMKMFPDQAKQFQKMNRVTLLQVLSSCLEQFKNNNKGSVLQNRQISPQITHKNLQILSQPSNIIQNEVISKPVNQSQIILQQVEMHNTNQKQVSKQLSNIEHLNIQASLVRKQSIIQFPQLAQEINKLTAQQINDIQSQLMKNTPSKQVARQTIKISSPHKIEKNASQNFNQISKDKSTSQMIKNQTPSESFKNKSPIKENSQNIQNKKSLQNSQSKSKNETQLIIRQILKLYPHLEQQIRGLSQQDLNNIISQFHANSAKQIQQPVSNKTIQNSSQKVSSKIVENKSQVLTNHSAPQAKNNDSSHIVNNQLESQHKNHQNVHPHPSNKINQAQAKPAQQTSKNLSNPTKISENIKNSQSLNNNQHVMHQISTTQQASNKIPNNIPPHASTHAPTNNPMNASSNISNVPSNIHANVPNPVSTQAINQVASTSKISTPVNSQKKSNPNQSNNISSNDINAMKNLILSKHNITPQKSQVVSNQQQKSNKVQHPKQTQNISQKRSFQTMATTTPSLKQPELNQSKNIKKRNTAQIRAKLLQKLPTFQSKISKLSDEELQNLFVQHIEKPAQAKKAELKKVEQKKVQKKKQGSLKIVQTKQGKTKIKTFILMQVQREQSNQDSVQKSKRTQKGIEKKNYEQCLLAINDLARQLAEMQE